MRSIPNPRVGARLCLVLAALLTVASSATAQAEHPLVARARAANPERFAFALAHGAEIVLTPDGRSFYLRWLPPGAGADPPVLVTLHGHASWAFDELYVWLPWLERHGVGLLAVQWWFGAGERPEDYYTPAALHDVIQPALGALGVGRGRAMLHGFSRGATNVYALKALDFVRGGGYFGLTLANAGGFADDYPPNFDLTSGRLGRFPLSLAAFALYCGGRDAEPERSGCPAMVRTEGRLAPLGARIVARWRDDDAEHGGFHALGRHVDESLELYLALRRDAPGPAVEEWTPAGIAVGEHAGNWQGEGSLIMPEVVKVPAVGYRMFYTVSTPTTARIDVAESADGASWHPVGTALAGRADPNDREALVGGPSLVELPNGRWRMYYGSSPVDRAGVPPGAHLRSAISRDGVHFEREPGVRIEIAPYDPASPLSFAGHGRVFRAADGTWTAIFSGNWRDDATPSDLVLATSRDGLTFHGYRTLYVDVHDPVVVRTDRGFLLYAAYLDQWSGRAVSRNGRRWPAKLSPIEFVDPPGRPLGKGAGFGDLGAVLSYRNELWLFANSGEPSRDLVRLVRR